MPSNLRPLHFISTLGGLLALLAACTPVPRPVTPERVLQSGRASWYGPNFHGKRTANGEVYDMHALTAAHKTLPFGTIVEVRNLSNGLRVVVRVNDRGPFVRGRIIDLSRAAAEAIEMIGPGTAKVDLHLFSQPAPERWTVQAGAFRDRERAQHLADLLGAEFGEVCIVSEEDWHRVRVGQFDDRDEALHFLRRVRRIGGEGSLIRLP